MTSLKRYWHYYLAAFLFILGIFFLSRSHANEDHFVDVSKMVYNNSWINENHCEDFLEIVYTNPHAIHHIELYFCKGLAYEQCNTTKQKWIFHKENADRCLMDAKNKCWYLPDLTDRKNAQYCMTNAGALCYPGTPTSKCIAVIINTMVQYGLDCCDEWQYINNKLYWAQYHFEMMEFYAEAMRNE